MPSSPCSGPSRCRSVGDQTPYGSAHEEPFARRGAGRVPKGPALDWWRTPRQNRRQTRGDKPSACRLRPVIGNEGYMTSASGVGTHSPGPTDRVAFFDEQRRNRRATWKLAAASALGVTLRGIPVSVVVTPLVYGVLLVCGHIINLFYPLPDAVTGRLSSFVQLVASVANRLAGNPVPYRASIPALLIFAAALELPGVAVM